MWGPVPPRHEAGGAELVREHALHLDQVVDGGRRLRERRPGRARGGDGQVGGTPPCGRRQGSTATCVPTGRSRSCAACPACPTRRTFGVRGGPGDGEHPLGDEHAGIQMAYAGRRFLQMVHETGRLGRIAFKPTQAMEDGINSGLLVLAAAGHEVQRRAEVRSRRLRRAPRAGRPHRQSAPDDFKDGMENWGGQIEQHISDTNYGLLLWDLM